MQYEQRQLQPTEICTQAWNSRSRRGGQVAGEALELEVALRGERVAGQELGQPVDLARAEGHVHEREHLEHLVLERLRPAAADADHPAGVLGLQPLGLAQVADQAAVGLLADGAGVEQDQVGAVAGRRLAVAERLEHALHALGVVLVHLAPEGGQVVGRSAAGRWPPSTAARLISRRAHRRRPAPWRDLRSCRPDDVVLPALARARLPALRSEVPAETRRVAVVGTRRLHDPRDRLRPARRAAPTGSRCSRPRASCSTSPATFARSTPRRGWRFTFVWDPPDRRRPGDAGRAGLRRPRRRDGGAAQQGPFATEERRALHDGGWGQSFGKLERLLAG